MAKIKVKALCKPITKLLEVKLYIHRDVYGNTYVSGRAWLNNDYDNVVYYPMQQGNAEQALKDIYATVCNMYKTLVRYKDVSLYELHNYGMYTDLRVSHVKAKECDHFGKCSI